MSGLSVSTLWAAAWCSAAVLLAAAASGRQVPRPAWAIPVLAVFLGITRSPLLLFGLLLLAALVVPRLGSSRSAGGWSRTLSLGALGALAALGAGLAGRQHGDEFLAAIILLGFLALLGCLPFGWHMVRWLEDAVPAVSALVIGALLPAVVAALVNSEGALAQVHGTQRAGFLLGLFGGATAVAGALYGMGARDWRQLAVRTAPCEVGLALVGVGAFDTRGLQAAALTLGVMAVTRPVLLFAGGLGSRRGGGLAVVAMALVGIAGLPPTLGFPARQLVLSAAARTHPMVATLAVMGILLEFVVLALVLRRRLSLPDDTLPAGSPAALRLLAVATGAALLLGGVFPGLLLRYVLHVGTV